MTTINRLRRLPPSARLFLVGVTVPLLCIGVLRLVPARPGPPCRALATQGAHEEDGRCIVDHDLSTQDYVQNRLPDNLSVHGTLVLYGCKVAKLPRGLYVEKSLELYKSCVTDLPPDLVVGGNIDATLGFGDDLLSCKKLPKTIRVGGHIRCE